MQGSASAAGGNSAANQQAQVQQANAAARQLVLQQSVDMLQTIYTNTLTTGVGTVINVPLRNVGLVKRFWVRVRATVTAGAQAQNLTPLGASNFFSNVILTDLSNQQRINTAGWQLNMVSSAKRRRPLGSAMTTDTPMGFGDNFTNVMSAPSQIPANGSGEIDMIFEVPCSYTDHDLRGAIYANVNNATFQLQLTVNPNMFVSSVSDPTLAVYQSTGANTATLTTFDIEVMQNYLDQLPRSNGQIVLPMLDLSTAYLLNNTAVSGVVQNQDNPIPYANFREFMSTILIYDNAGVLNTGSDITYFALQTANYTNIFKESPKFASFFARTIVGDDFPPGTYYFDHRNKPINTRQYGNMELIINPSNVGGATAAFLIGWEALAIINLVTGAGSLFGT